VPRRSAAVDVVVVTWNTRDLTLAALTHLRAAASGSTVTLLVQDNGSSDGTAAAIAAAYPDADVEAGPTNLGFAAGVNRALLRSSAPWVMLLNSDAWPEPGALERLLECAARHPRAAAVAPKLLRPDDRLEHSTWPFPSLRVATAAACTAGRYVWPHDEERAVDWAVGAALLLRRSALDAIGDLDDSLFMYAEDLDWCWRAHDASWETWFTPDAVVRHVGNASGAQRYGDRRSAAWINNSVRVYRKHHAWPSTAAWQVANAAGAGISACRARRRGEAERSHYWLAQVRPWLRRPHDDRRGAIA
jgi:N-acetylglucosaminyl-diphospho-decaprenol L-rhamnosyltransferase